MEEDTATPHIGKSRYAHIVGWGADLDHANRPGYPMERTPPRLVHPPHALPTQQHSDVEILCSNERDGVTPVYGASLPPKGLSGGLRRLAFKFSESDVRHWMLLLMADRVQVGEGLVSDLARGHIPNLYAEMGGPAELRYNRAGALRKAALGVGVLLVAAIYLQHRSGRR